MKPPAILIAVLALTPITALAAEFKIGPHAFTLPDPVSLLLNKLAALRARKGQAGDAESGAGPRIC